MIQDASGHASPHREDFESFRTLLISRSPVAADADSSNEPGLITSTLDTLQVDEDVQRTVMDDTDTVYRGPNAVRELLSDFEERAGENLHQCESFVEAVVLSCLACKSA